MPEQINRRLLHYHMPSIFRRLTSFQCDVQLSLLVTPALVPPVALNLDALDQLVSRRDPKGSEIGHLMRDIIVIPV